MPSFSSLGNKGLLWILFGLILLCLPNRRNCGAQILIALLLSLIFCNLLIKNWVARPRPFELNTVVQLLIMEPVDYSFPSGHTSAAFATAAVLWKNRCWERHVAFVVAVLMGFSRLYLYVHYPSDVLGGAVLGTMLGVAAVVIYRTLWKRFRGKRGLDSC